MSWSQCAYKQCAQELLQILGDKNNERSVDWSNIWKSRHFSFFTGLVDVSQIFGRVSDLTLKRKRESLRIHKVNMESTSKTPQDMKFQKESKRLCFLYTYDFHSFFYPRLLLEAKLLSAPWWNNPCLGSFRSLGILFCSLRLANFRDTNMLQLSTSNQEQKGDLLETSIWRALHIGVNLFGPKNGSTSYAFLAQWMLMNAVSHLDGPEALGFQNDDTKITMQTTSNNYRYHSQHEESWR